MDGDLDEVAGVEEMDEGIERAMLRAPGVLVARFGRALLRGGRIRRGGGGAFVRGGRLEIGPTTCELFGDDRLFFSTSFFFVLFGSKNDAVLVVLSKSRP